MSEHSEREAVFKPRYRIGHWWKLATSFLMLLLPILLSLQQNLHLRYARLAGETPVAIPPHLSALVLLITLIGILGLLHFCSGEHIHKITIQGSKVVLHRLLGRRIVTHLAQVSWHSEALYLGKYHSFSFSHVANRDALIHTLAQPTTSGICPAKEDGELEEGPDGSGDDAPWLKLAAESKWYNLVVILIVLLGCGVLYLWGMLQSGEIPAWVVWSICGFSGYFAATSAYRLIQRLIK